MGLQGWCRGALWVVGALCCLFMCGQECYRAHTSLLSARWKRENRGAARTNQTYDPQISSASFLHPSLFPSFHPLFSLLPKEIIPQTPSYFGLTTSYLYSHTHPPSFLPSLTLPLKTRISQASIIVAHTSVLLSLHAAVMPLKSLNSCYFGFQWMSLFYFHGRNTQLFFFFFCLNLRSIVFFFFLSMVCGLLIINLKKQFKIL